MDPATITLIAGILLKYGPDMMMKFVAMYKKKEVVQEDWDEVFKLATEKSYEDYVKKP